MTDERKKAEMAAKKAEEKATKKAEEKAAKKAEEKAAKKAAKEAAKKAAKEAAKEAAKKAAKEAKKKEGKKNKTEKPPTSGNSNRDGGGRGIGVDPPVSGANNGELGAGKGNDKGEKMKGATGEKSEHSAGADGDGSEGKGEKPAMDEKPEPLTGGESNVGEGDQKEDEKDDTDGNGKSEERDDGGRLRKGEVSHALWLQKSFSDRIGGNGVAYLVTLMDDFEPNLIPRSISADDTVDAEKLKSAPPMTGVPGLSSSSMPVSNGGGGGGEIPASTDGGAVDELKRKLGNEAGWSPFFWLAVQHL
jgi:hypothetical protein